MFLELRKHLCCSLFLIKLQATLLKIRSFTEHLQWLLLWFLQQNNLIFSVITITLGYNQKLSWKYKNKKSLYKNKKSLYKNIHLLSKVRLSSPKILQPFPPKSKHLDPLKHIFCIISIFLRRSGVSHSYTVQLIEGPSRIDCLIYQEENSPLPQTCS